MTRTIKCLAGALLLAALSGCAGINQNGNLFSAHGECLNLVGFQIPRDSMDLAKAQVPARAQVSTIYNTPSDLNSLFGVLSRILGVGFTSIGGTAPVAGADTSK